MSPFSLVSHCGNFKTPTKALFAVPANICAEVLTAGECNQQTPSAAGLVSIPVQACIAVLGEAQCSAVSKPVDGTPAAENPYALISVPVDVCAAVSSSAD